MASQPRSREREQGRRLRVRTLVVASVASLTAALVTSRLWIAGTPLRYRGRGAGISAHRDHLRYRLLVAVLSLQGNARLAIVADRAGSRALASWHCRPGDVVLLRAPGWAGLDDGRPLHLVECDAGERLSLSLRMDSRPDCDAPANRGCPPARG